MLGLPAHPALGLLQLPARQPQPEVNKNDMQVITMTGKNRILVVWNEKIRFKWIGFLFKYSEMRLNKGFRVKVGSFIKINKNFYLFQWSDYLIFPYTRQAE